MNAFEYLCKNGDRYRKLFVGPDGAKGHLYIGGIRQLRNDMGLLLKDAKDAFDMWISKGYPSESMSIDTAKILVKNLLLSPSVTLTSLERDALELLVR